MEELIALFIQFVVEVLLEVLGTLPWDMLSYRWDDRTGCSLVLLTLLAGGAVGGISVLIFPHTMLHHGWSRMGNLIVAPLLSGGMAWLMAKRRERRGRAVPELRHFWHSFGFTFALAAVRLAYCNRG